VFRFDVDARKVLEEETTGNTVSAKGANVHSQAPQPVQLKDAVTGIFASEGGDTVLKVALDDSARLSWAIDVGGRSAMPLSPLGITVGRTDFGRRIVPMAAERVKLSSSDFREFEKVSFKTSVRKELPFVRNAVTNFAVDVNMRGWAIPLRDIVSGNVTATLEVRVWNGGAAVRWRVPEDGECFIYGENTCFLKGDREYIVHEWNRPQNHPEALVVPRGKHAAGIVFPEFPRGWMHNGELVTPWRGMVAK
jgi:hypothetical protein